MSEANVPGAAGQEDEGKRPGVLDGIDPIDPVVRSLVDKSETAACQIADNGADAAVSNGAVESAAEGGSSIVGEAASSVVEVIGNILDGL